MFLNVQCKSRYTRIGNLQMLLEIGLFKKKKKRKRKKQTKEKTKEINIALSLGYHRLYRLGSSLVPFYRGGSRIFFRRGCTRLLLYFNTNKPHSFFEYQLYEKTAGHLRGGAHPLHPPPRSAPVLTMANFRCTVTLRDCLVIVLFD